MFITFYFLFYEYKCNANLMTQQPLYSIARYVKKIHTVFLLLMMEKGRNGIFDKLVTSLKGDLLGSFHYEVPNFILGIGLHTLVLKKHIKLLILYSVAAL